MVPSYNKFTQTHGHRDTETDFGESTLAAHLCVLRLKGEAFSFVRC